MLRSTSPLRARPGFTLVELLVGAAIVVIIMIVLATCFQIAIDTMRETTATVDLASQLRSADTVIRRDLTADHFLPEPGKPHDGVHLSDQTLDALYIGSNQLLGWRPPQAGFFRMRSTVGILEGVDADNLTSWRATDHFLHFSSILPDTVDAHPYTAMSGGQQYKSRAAEIAIFLDPAPTGSTGGSSPLPLYRLIRRQRLAALNQGYVGNYPTNDNAVISTRTAGTTISVNTLADLAHPDYRLGRSRAAVPTTGTGDDGAFAPLSSSGLVGDDILLANVISFEVRATWTSAASTTLPAKLPYVRGPTPFTLGSSTDHPFDSLPPVPPTASPAAATPPDPAHTQGNTVLLGQNIFDTWSTQLTGWNTINAAGELTASPDIAPLLIRVQAIQIRIRVWDLNTQTTRQITIVQDM